MAEFLNPEQLDSFLTLFKGNVAELPVILCAVYGFRRSEVLGLKWHNIDFVKKAITISETLQQNTGGDYIDTPKTDSSYRTLSITEGVYNLLTTQKNYKMSGKIRGSYYANSDYVCAWDNGTVISPNYLTKTFHSVVSKSTLPQIRLHDLRHSVASNLLDIVCINMLEKC